MRTKCLIIIGVAALIGAAGCQKRTPSLNNSPALDNSPAVSTASAAASPLDQANRAFLSNNYVEAARGYENYLQLTTPGAPEREDVLFRLAFIFAVRPAPETDWPRATALFNQLMDEFPNSPLKESVGLILQLREDLDQKTSDVKAQDQKIRQLTTELDRLKKIDSDRRKRP